VIHDRSPYRPPQTISTSPDAPTRVRYWVLGGFCVAAAIAYIQRYGINLLAPSIQQELEVDKVQMGRVMAGFFAGYAVLQIPSGWAGDRWGSRKTLALLALSWSLATALMGSAWDFTSLLTIWTLAGMAQAGLFPCAMIGLTDWLPITNRGMASGMLSTFMNVGAVISPLLAGWLVSYFSWRDVFLWLSIPGIAWAGWYAWWYRDRPSQHASVNRAERELISLTSADGDTSHAKRLPTPWLRLTTSWRMWLIGIQQFLRAAAQVFFGTWFATFLYESPGISDDDVAILASVPPALLIAGSLVGGGLSDWLQARTGSRRVSRQGLAVVNLLLCAAMFAAAALAGNDYVRVALISCGCLFMTIGGVSAYAITMDLGGGHVGSVFSTMNMFGSIGAAVFPAFAGWLAARSGNWDSVLFSMAAIYVAAAVCWALLDPDGTLFDDENEG
jgi:MFS transporter, ACS family, D-galactonate transporter